MGCRMSEREKELMGRLNMNDFIYKKTFTNFFLFSLEKFSFLVNEKWNKITTLNERTNELPASFAFFSRYKI